MISNAFNKGYHAGYRGDKSNPYPHDSEEAKEWWLGYEEARVDIRNGR